MSWLTELFFSGHETANAITVVALVAVLGLAVGEIKIGTVKLGIAGPLFVGISLGLCSPMEGRPNPRGRGRVTPGIAGLRKW